MKTFFYYATDYPSGSGFEMFGTVHIIWLVILTVFSVMFASFYGYMRNNNKEGKIRILIGVIMPVISMYRDIVLMITGHFDRFYLPLHLCGMALWIGSLYCFTKWRFAGVVYVLLCVPGAISALLFPDWVDYPLFNYMHIHDFFSHGIIVAWGVCLFTSGEVLPKWKELWMPVAFGLLGVLFIYTVNNILVTNYWFLNYPSAGSPLESIFELTGKKWYIPGYILFVFFVVLIWMCIIRGISFIKINRRK